MSLFFFFKQKTAYEMRISDWSSDVCSSDLPAWVVSRAQAFHDLRGLVPISAMQLEYSLVQRSIEREHLPLARAHDIGVTAWSPLAGGILTGKYTRKGADTGSKRMDTMQLQPLDARNREIAGALDGIAEELGVTSGQLALAWMMSRDVIPIVGATRAEQLRENLARSEEHTSELQSLMRSTYDVLCVQQNKHQ